MLNALPLDITRCGGAKCPAELRKKCQRTITKMLDYQWEVMHPKTKLRVIPEQKTFNPDGNDSCEYFIRDTR